MKGFLERTTNKFTNNIKGIVLEGGGTTIFLALLALLIAANTFRVFSKGSENYSTYIQEKQDLDSLQSKNQSLKDEYNYVSSDEYKLLLLRDSENLAKGNESLFQTKQAPQYFDVQTDYLDLKDKKNFDDWWGTLIR